MPAEVFFGASTLAYPPRFSVSRFNEIVPNNIESQTKLDQIL